MNGPSKGKRVAEWGLGLLTIPAVIALTLGALALAYAIAASLMAMVRMIPHETANETWGQFGALLERFPALWVIWGASIVILLAGNALSRPSKPTRR